jgi:hypothetical protein
MKNVKFAVDKKLEAMGATALSNMQKELLKLYATNIPDEELLEIKLLLSNYFAEKATKEVDKHWEENNWNKETMNKWANEHNRSKGSH